MKFIKKSELQLINGGYLANKSNEPVMHENFLFEQERAHYVVSLAAAIKDKDFKGKKADNLQDIINKVTDTIYKEASKKYVETPKAPALKTRDAMTKEALTWVKHKDEVELIDAVNEEMQQFNTISDFEEFGLYFEEGLVKLTKIYTIKEIVDAVTALKKVI